MGGLIVDHHGGARQRPTMTGPWRSTPRSTSRRRTPAWASRSCRGCRSSSSRRCARPPQAKGYMTALVARPPPVVPPALFLISREGHTNINQPERLLALRALNAWIDEGPDALPRPPRTRRVLRRDDRAGSGPVDGNVPCRAGAASTAGRRGRRGLRQRAPRGAGPGFRGRRHPADDVLHGRGPGGHSFRALYGRNYTDVKTGEWVAFPDADGRTVLSRVLADAAGTASLKVGDPVSLTRSSRAAGRLP